MLSLKEIKKDYESGSTRVEALKGVSISFRESEFVAILGPSGCGKTTLLNIVGGLDQYTSGDLVINGKSTKDFTGPDWDTYRNHSIGFVFQSYNLIPHQTVLANVELALTLSGVGKTERRRRAKKALEQVGLGNQLKKKPNQMSGGQMQRVAIARALVNDPDILLADEPTGALDSETSLQVMEILKNISKEKLVVMVTHNPDLAATFATRTVRLLDGRITDDTNPYNPTVVEPIPKAKQKAEKHTSMSFLTALSLSFNNLRTKKGRTILTAFAGSIGIIGIALILSLSNGIQAYIDQVQEDTLSSYPISIESETLDMSTMVETMMGSAAARSEHETDKVYSSAIMADLLNSMLTMETRQNDLAGFKAYLEAHDEEVAPYISAITYDYATPLYIYKSDDTVTQLNPSNILSGMMAFGGQASNLATSTAYGAYSTNQFSQFLEAWEQMLPGKNGELINELVFDQYDVLAGRWPENENEVVLMVNEYNEISDLMLYMLGLKDPAGIQTQMMNAMMGNTVDAEVESWTYDELLQLTFTLLLPTDRYAYDEATDTWTDKSGDAGFMANALKNGTTLRLVGIMKPNADAAATSMSGAIGYTAALMDRVIERTAQSPIVVQQQADPGRDLISGKPFRTGTEEEWTSAQKAEAVREVINGKTVLEKAAVCEKLATAPTQEEIDLVAGRMMAELGGRPGQEQLVMAAYAAQTGLAPQDITGYITAMTDAEIEAAAGTVVAEMAKTQYAEKASEMFASMTAEELAALTDIRLAAADEDTLAALYEDYCESPYAEGSADENLAAFGMIFEDKPSAVNIYASSFANKDQITNLISDYNKSVSAEKKLRYVDYVGLIMSSVTTILNAISYVLIGFVSISLVVSSIMIGIITYISVLERTKEIGILRAIGASKRDISRVFNAETLIVGFTSGAIGIGMTLLLNIPINLILRNVANISATSFLPYGAGFILVGISMLLTLIAGLIPSRLAAKKDPVIALRSE